MITLLLMAGIALFAALLALWPLVMGQPARGIARQRLNIVGYRTRMAEIDIEHAAGSLDDAQAQALRDEADARLLVDAEPTTPREAVDASQTSGPVPRAWGLAVLLALLVAGLSAWGYWLSDSRHQAALIAQAQVDPAAAQQHAIDDMIAQLEARLKAEPNNAQGWVMLGRSYGALNRVDDAISAYERANRISVADPQADWLADEGEMRALAGDDGFAGLPAQLFDRALALDPAQPKALWYGGLAAAQVGDYATAVTRWQALRGVAELPDDFKAVLDQRLPELIQLAGDTLPATSPTLPSSPSATTGTPTRASPSANAGTAVATQLILEVSLAAEFVDTVQPSDTLFVVARRPGGGGPPLAVQRLRVSDLPTQITLDDSNAMAPGVTLSSADHWEVIARISRSGSPMAQSGDVEGRLQLGQDALGSARALTINTRVP